MLGAWWCWWRRRRWPGHSSLTCRARLQQHILTLQRGYFSLLHVALLAEVVDVVVAVSQHLHQAGQVARQVADLLLLRGTLLLVRAGGGLQLRLHSVELMPVVRCVV